MAGLGLSKAGRPRGSFLFLGPTGMGKTELTQVFTGALFGMEKLVRFDMSEFQTQESLGLLLGSRPGESGFFGAAYNRTKTGTLMSLWDIFRAESPLLTLTQPDRVNDLIRTMLTHYTIFDHHALPVWPEGGMETWCMIGKLGGDDQFTARLDEMFDTMETIPNLRSIPDVTGVIGMYSQGNEPDHHVAYLYNYAGQPWKTQTRVRQLANTLYTNTPAGICGNDDCGQMSAWYVFTTLGFYPVDPASGIYVLGSPLVDEATLKLDPKFYHGRTFTVIAKNNSTAHPYIQSATLNGQPLTRSWISQAEIAAGGKLVLTMGPVPNKDFGSAPADRPPQM
jgi:putative alpha-1,2-mannosidase